MMLFRFTGVAALLSVLASAESPAGRDRPGHDDENSRLAWTSQPASVAPVLRNLERPTIG